MTREYLVVYEKGANNWSAFSPDLPGCGSLGDALEDTRTNMREAIEVYLNETAKAGEQIPEAIATSVDFEEFDQRVVRLIAFGVGAQCDSLGGDRLLRVHHVGHHGLDERVCL